MINKVTFSCLSILLVTLFLTSCASVPIENRIDHLPMYGQPEIPRPEHLIKADEDFIKRAAAGFGGDRHQASMAWHSAAEKYMSEGNSYYAMRRYNQSWLLDPENYLPYWGFGRVMVDRDKIDEAIKYFETANALINDPYQKSSLLSDTGSVYSYKAESIPSEKITERKYYFDLANQYFKNSTSDDPSYPVPWYRWAISLYEQGRYEDAWEKVNKALQLGAENLDVFLRELENKMPNPNQ